MPRAAIPEEVVKVPRWSWDEVREYFATQHKLGEHVAIEGPTGTGKTTLALELLVARGARPAKDRRPTRVTVLETKRRDRTTQALFGLGWSRVTKIDEWPPNFGEEHTVVWPAPGPTSAASRPQKPLFLHVLDEIEESGQQIVYLDEAADFTDPESEGGFGLRGMLSIYWRRSRSAGISLVAATQRPVAVPRLMWDSSSWFFLFRPEDEDDLKRIAQLSGFKELALDIVPRLDMHEFLMLRRRPDRIAVISQVTA